MSLLPAIARNGHLFQILLKWKNASSLRHSSRKDCAEVLEPKCTEENLAKLPPCPAKVRRELAGEKYDPPPPHVDSMWEFPECCIDPCPDPPVRMDELYYKTSDKKNRKYQQTWVPCPPLHIKEVPVCCFEKLKFPPMETRKREEAKKAAKNACSIKPKIKMPCKSVKQQKCPRFMLKNCPAARNPPKCIKTIKRDCVPEKTPYPSYSECLKCELDPLRPVECRCLDPPMMCLVWAEYRKRLNIVKGGGH